MSLALEIVDVLLRILWSFLERAYRLVVPVPRKKIDGEIVLITGGGGGIAECMAMELAKLNVTIVLWDINEEANERVAKKVREQGATVHTFRCDLTNREEVYRVADEVKRQVGHVTILINNAGLLYARSLLNTTDKQLAMMVEVNTISHFWTTKAFLPHMCRMNHGHIVTIASMAGKTGCGNLIGYSASKYGAVGFHESLRTELHGMGKTGVKTTCVCPVFVETPLIKDTIVKTRFPSQIPVLKPEQVADEVVDGILRDKNFVYIPKKMNFNLFLNRAVEILADFYDAGFVDENAQKAFEEPEEIKASHDDKKSE